MITWIYKIARNVYYQWYRKKGISIVHIGDDWLNIPDKGGPEEFFDRKEKNKSIGYALMQISEKYREVLRARLEFKKYYIEKGEC